MKLGYSVNGDSFGSALEGVIEHARLASAESADDIAEAVLEEAKRRCPVASGALRDSGRWLKSKTSKPDQERRRVQFGGVSAPYAIVVHFNPNATHTTGEARWLENAVEVQFRKAPDLINYRFNNRRLPRRAR